MSTITTLPTAISPDSKGIIDTNFSNLNTDKAETSALTSGLATKQDTLVSGTNIKTVNGNSLLGSGDVVISGGSGTLAGLTDVDIVAPANGEIIAYNSTSTKWENVPLSGGGDMLASTYDPAGGARQVSFACTTQTAITDYTFTGSEARDSGYLVTTASNRTVNIDADLFSTGYEVSICKGTNNANTVTLDAQAGNNINGSQTFVLTQYNEVVTLLKDGADTWKIKNHYYPISGTNTGDQTSIVGITGTKAQFDTAVTDGNILYVGDIVSASTTAQGIAEASIASEVNTGTDADRYVSPDSLAGSNFGIKYVACSLNGTTALTTSDKAYFRIPSAITGMDLVSVSATVGTGASGSSSSGVPTFTVKNVTDGNQMLSTSLTVDASEYTSATATTPAVINTSFDDVVTDDLIEVACTVAGTGVTYATITLGFQLA